MYNQCSEYRLLHNLTRGVPTSIKQIHTFSPENCVLLYKHAFHVHCFIGLVGSSYVVYVFNFQILQGYSAFIVTKI